MVCCHIISDTDQLKCALMDCRCQDQLIHEKLNQATDWSNTLFKHHLMRTNVHKNVSWNNPQVGIKCGVYTRKRTELDLPYVLVYRSQCNAYHAKNTLSKARCCDFLKTVVLPSPMSAFSITSCQKQSIWAPFQGPCITFSCQSATSILDKLVYYMQSLSI